MTKRDRIKQLAVRFGFLGCFGIFIGIALASGLDISEHASMGFLPLHKSISELGYYGHANFALVVNGGLFFGSLCIALSSLFALQITSGWLKYPFWLFLTASFIAQAATGLFPLNVYHLHVGALSFAILFSSIASVFFIVYVMQMKGQRLMLPLVLAICCLLVNLSMFALPYAGIIASPTPTMTYIDLIADSATIAPKPALWWQSLLQWLSCFSLIIWVVSLLGWLNKTTEAHQ
ncbi:hypothetical protein [Shewanella aestuarii]|uniref:DUF998 domain-containing protein n=1 Tax=Shewanella aestuarii TaxID=1028752 RepID=A0A6G9QIV3_9GAMM|nr:hypothetical protein [Shewanella aestuarii]QIR13809.1 hypothetical protein HBH39_04245 [Shewanella aestuarii]